MNITDAIYKRRSIRKFEDKPIPHEDILKIIAAGMLAPSAKNRQPWRFVVVEGQAKAGMLDAMNRGLEREAATPKLPQSAAYIGGAKNTVAIMEQAPVTVFVINPLNATQDFPQDWEARFYEIANLQSAGACIQNMLLVAEELGYGSLWICDIDFAYEEMLKWLSTSEQIVAAVSFGVPAQSPQPRPRYEVDAVTAWKSE